MALAAEGGRLGGGSPKGAVFTLELEACGALTTLLRGRLSMDSQARARSLRSASGAVPVRGRNHRLYACPNPKHFVSLL